ncbi:hypothetical protein JHW43_002986 [Diplocarpon mali]|nr:hypothetical protein JHW43_002986 [Diplocarpon mali]
MSLTHETRNDRRPATRADDDRDTRVGWRGSRVMFRRSRPSFVTKGASRHTCLSAAGGFLQEPKHLLERLTTVPRPPRGQLGAPRNSSFGSAPHRRAEGDSRGRNSTVYTLRGTLVRTVDGWTNGELIYQPQKENNRLLIVATAPEQAPRVDCVRSSPTTATSTGSGGPVDLDEQHPRGFFDEYRSSIGFEKQPLLLAGKDLPGTASRSPAWVDKDKDKDKGKGSLSRRSSHHFLGRVGGGGEDDEGKPAGPDGMYRDELLGSQRNGTCPVLDSAHFHPNTPAWYEFLQSKGGPVRVCPSAYAASTCAELHILLAFHISPVEERHCTSSPFSHSQTPSPTLCTRHSGQICLQSFWPVLVNSTEWEGSHVRMCTLALPLIVAALPPNKKGFKSFQATPRTPSLLARPLKLQGKVYPAWPNLPPDPRVQMDYCDVCEASDKVNESSAGPQPFPLAASARSIWYSIELRSG